MNQGFTLVEMIVVVAVIGITSALVVVAYPNVRGQQKLTLVEQQLQTTLREAQQQAINENRDKDCLIKVSDPAVEKNCSNIGVQLNNTTDGGEFIVFADINQPDKNEWNAAQDYEVKRTSFPVGVKIDTAASSATTFIFEGAPPTVKLFADANEVTTPATVVFNIGTATTSLDVQSYGQVEKQ